MGIAVQSATGFWSVACGAYGKRLAMPWAGDPPALAPDASRLDLATLDAELDQLLGKSVQPAQVRLHPDGAEALAALKGAFRIA